MALFVLAVLGNCLAGAAILHLLQTYVLRKRTPDASAAPAVAVAASEKAQPSRSPEHTAWLEALVDRVEGNISRHAVEVEELADELAAVPPDDPSSLMAVAAAML
ncbi:MAG TPA: hypothetical protein VGX76_13095, partial [Pirellulales bacterium]|nr:hypothetical protein [Pirellulales bacterium]